MDWRPELDAEDHEPPWLRIAAFMLLLAASLFLFVWVLFPFESFVQALASSGLGDFANGKVSGSFMNLHLWTPEKELMLAFPALLDSLQYWFDYCRNTFYALVLAGLFSFLRLAQICKLYSRHLLYSILTLLSAALLILPLAFLIDWQGYEIRHVLMEAANNLIVSVKNRTTALDVACASGSMAACLGGFFIFIWMLKLIYFPAPSLKRVDKGLSISAGIWGFIFGTKYIAYEQVKKVSLGADAKGKERLFLKTNNAEYVFSKEESRKILGNGEFLSDLRTYAPEAVSANFKIKGDAGDQQYTELWLKYFSSETKRERSGALKGGDLLKDGRFEIAGELGQGGQGTAYLAVEKNNSSDSESSSNTLVLKEYILPVHRGEAIFQQSLARFEHEAGILARIEHANVVALKESFVEDHRAYLVLEFVEGETLKQVVLKQGRLDEPAVVEIAIQLLNALDYMHNLDPPIIHRDLSPDNLILQADGTVKLVDFNVAQIQAAAQATATVVGKHAYIPPEQFRGKANNRSDIFALGGSLHFMLTGQEPEPLSISHPKKLEARVSAELDSIIAKATAIDQNERYQNAIEMRNDLYDLARKKSYELNSIAQLQSESQPQTQLQPQSEAQAPSQAILISKKELEIEKS